MPLQDSCLSPSHPLSGAVRQAEEFHEEGSLPQEAAGLSCGRSYNC